MLILLLFFYDRLQLDLCFLINLGPKRFGRENCCILLETFSLPAYSLLFLVFHSQVLTCKLTFFKTGRRVIFETYVEYQQ